jgi:3-hydroxyisobutyrate dehydrogenase-like beta-hydroxyacid dehydrogenase
MLTPPEKPGATVLLGKKDMSLFLTAAKAGNAKLTIAERVAARFDEAIAEGLGGEDWAAGLLNAARLASK